MNINIERDIESYSWNQIAVVFIVHVVFIMQSTA